jgi:tetratricopeptide (TPR) repeat protein
MEKGAAEVEALLRDNPNSAVAHVLVGEALDGQGKPAEALKEFEAAAAINDIAPNVHFAIGFLHWRDKRFDDAEREFRRELALDPAHCQAMAYLGDIEVQRGNNAEARALLSKASAARADIRIAEYDLGVILQKAGEFEPAVRHFERAVALAPDRADAHYRLAACYRALGRDREAQAELALVAKLHDRKLDETIYNVAPAPRAEPQP